MGAHLKEQLFLRRFEFRAARCRLPLVAYSKFKKVGFKIKESMDSLANEGLTLGCLGAN